MYKKKFRLLVIFTIIISSHIGLVIIWIYDHKNRSSYEHEVHEFVNDMKNELDFSTLFTDEDTMFHNKELQIKDFKISFYYPDSATHLNRNTQRIIASNETEGWSLIRDEHDHYFKEYSCPNCVYGKMGNNHISIYNSYWDMFHTKRAYFWLWSEYARKLEIVWMPWLGSLAGLARDGFALPWMGDVDIIMRRSDIAKLQANPFPRYFYDFRYCLVSNWKTELKNRKGNKGGCPMYGPIARLGDFHPKKRYASSFDIYAFDIRTKADGNQTLFSEYGGKTIDYDLIFPLQNCTFLSMKVPCPVNPQEVVSKIYGENGINSYDCKNGRWFPNN